MLRPSTQVELPTHNHIRGSPRRDLAHLPSKQPGSHVRCDETFQDVLLSLTTSDARHVVFGCTDLPSVIGAFEITHQLCTREIYTT